MKFEKSQVGGTNVCGKTSYAHINADGLDFGCFDCTNHWSSEELRQIADEMDKMKKAEMKK